MSLNFDRSFQGTPGEIVELFPGIRRVTANNPGPMTFLGTNTYILGSDPVAVVDPGPADSSHLNAIDRAIRGASVGAILVTHTHRDHTGLCAPLKAATGAPLIGARRHSLAIGTPMKSLEASEAIDESYRPDLGLEDGEEWSTGDLVIEAVATPGHTRNHLCFALKGSDLLLSGDHVMGWSTTLIAPPDGDMTTYLESLTRLSKRKEHIYLPGHGERIVDAKAHVKELFAHRMSRESEIMRVLADKSLTAGQIADAIYSEISSPLKGAATLSVLAHLLRLEQLRKVKRLHLPVGQGSGALEPETTWQEIRWSQIEN
ncbi:MAG: MBL fold metallo-hydrolase [Pseudomonadota bacterium]